MHNTKRVVAGAATTMMIGSLCPWASALGLAQASGLAVTFGWVTLLAGALIGLLELDPGWLERRAPVLRRRRRRFTFVLASCGALACLLVLLGLDNYGGEIVSPAWGLYLTLIASLAVCWSARRPREAVLSTGV